MKRMHTSCLVAAAACFGLLACGDTASGTNDNKDPIDGQTAGSNGDGANGGAGSGLKDGDPVDTDGDGNKDDGVAIDSDGDGKVDGVDTDGDGKVDTALPGGSGSATGGGNGAGTNAGSGTTAGGTTAGGDDAGPDDVLSCDGVGICDDNFKDTCDGMPDTCPATQSSGIDEPTWDCAGDPPANVYAYATFADGTKTAGANLAPGACVVFFEGAKDLFYAKWFKFGPKTVTADCSEYDGCICPSGAGNNWDRRLYAFTWTGDAKCPEVSLVDHGKNDAGVKNEQPVSNACRKYLYALHGDGKPPIFADDGQPAFDLPFSFVTASLPALKRRLTDFPQIEVSCVEVKGVPVPKAQLMVSDVKNNAGFKKKI